MTHLVRFSDARYPPLALPDGAVLSEHLSVVNSPVLFGCRTGICGTCLSRVEGELPPPSADEREVLDIFAPDLADARLLCQLRVRGDLLVVEHLG